MVAPLFSAEGRSPEREEDRVVVNCTFYVLPIGARRRDFPERYGPHSTADDRYVRCAKRSVWRNILDALACDQKYALVFMDSSIVKVH